MSGKVRYDAELNTRDFDRANRGLQDQLTKVGVGVKAIGVAALAAAAGMVGLAAGLLSASRAAAVQLEAERKLENAIRTTGATIDANKIKKYAADLQSVTKFGDEATIAAAALLTTFGATERQLISLLPKIQDMAAFTGVDLKVATQAVGRALAGQVGGLSRYGVALNDVEKENFKFADQAGRTAIVLDALTTRFGGAARVAADTATGAWTQLQNALGDTKEEIGKLAEEPLKQFFQDLSLAIGGPGGINENVANLAPFVDAVTTSFRAMIPIGKQAVAIFEGIGIALSGDAGAASGRELLADKIIELQRQIRARKSELERAGQDPFGQIVRADDARAEIARLEVIVANMSRRLQSLPEPVSSAGGPAGQAASLPGGGKRPTKRGITDADLFATVVANENEARARLQKQLQTQLDDKLMFIGLEDEAEQNRLKAREKAEAESNREREREQDRFRQLELKEEKRQADALVAVEQAQAQAITDVSAATFAILVGTSQTLIDDLITGQEQAFERALAGFLKQTGGMLVARGTQAVVEGALISLNPLTPGAGIPLAAAGAAAIGIGLGMGAAGTAVGHLAAGGTIGQPLDRAGSERGLGSGSGSSRGSQASAAPVSITIQYGVGGMHEEDIARGVIRALDVAERRGIRSVGGRR